MRIDKTQSWLSNTVEGTFNTPESTGSNYEFIPTRNPFFLLPMPEKVSDADRVGRNAASHLCSTYWSHPEVSISDDLETGVPGRLFRRALGGSVTDTTVDTGVYDHEFAILNPTVGDSLPSSSLAALLGAASFLLAGMRVDRFRVEQSGADRVQYTADLVGSGKFARPHGLTSLPALAETVCMDGFRTEVTYVDDSSSTINLSTLGTLLSWFVEHRNNHRRNKRRSGDTVLTVDSGTAAHVRSMPRGKYETEIGMAIDFVDLTQWTATVQNKTYTNLKFKMVGPIISGAYRHEVEIIVPKFAFEVITPGDDEGDATQEINIIPFQDPTSGGTITGRVRNATATLV